MGKLDPFYDNCLITFLAFQSKYIILMQSIIIQYYYNNNYKDYVWSF